MKQLKFILYALIIAVQLIGCSPKKEEIKIEKFKNGVFLVNEGNFNKGNGSISFYSKSSEEVQSDVFKAANQDRPLGDVVQDFYIHENTGWIVVNNSNKIEVVDMSTFESKKIIEGLKLPRHIIITNNKAYVTETVDYTGLGGRVSVIDLSNYTILKTIQVGTQPDQLIFIDGKIFVTNAGEKTISVINTASDQVEQTIDIEYSPNSLTYDGTSLWVLCGGKKVYLPDYSGFDASASTAGALQKINPSNYQVSTEFTFDSKVITPLYLNLTNEKMIYVYNNKIYTYTTNDKKATILVDNTTNTYALGIEPSTDIIYRSDNNGFSKNSTIYRYNLDGTAINSFQSGGIGTNGFIFQ